MNPINLAIVVHDDDTATLHLHDCDGVQAARILERPILTMYDCQHMPAPDDFPDLTWHTCLDQQP